MYNLSSRISYRVKLALDHIKDSYNRYVNTKMSRNKARAYRKELIERNGKSFVDRQLMKEIKKYCREVLGSESYWPWLALYTELRGEFKRGWMPDDYYRFELLTKMNPERYMGLSDAKILDHKLFNGFTIAPLFFRSNGQFCLKDGTVISKIKLQSMLNNLDDEIIIKPDNGRGGRNIMFKHSSELRLDELPSGTNLLVQRVAKQHEELNKLYPHSVNTFRVLTFIDNGGKVKIKFIFLRFGRDGTRVDNASSGGAWVFIDPKGRIVPPAYETIGLPIGDVHPNTGIKYTDLKLPFLSKVKDFCKEVHRSFPHTRIIGWDVFIDEQGEPKLIEWNANNPILWVPEALFGPFFDDLLINKPGLPRKPKQKELKVTLSN